MTQQLVKRKKVKETPVFPTYSNTEALLQKYFSLKTSSEYNTVLEWVCD